VVCYGGRSLLAAEEEVGYGEKEDRERNFLSDFFFVIFWEMCKK
jgi:hypothetical protein